MLREWLLIEEEAHDNVNDIAYVLSLCLLNDILKDTEALHLLCEWEQVNLKVRPALD